jgi:poly(3-hydroxybutyrate) depolymerase
VTDSPDSVVYQGVASRYVDEATSFVHDGMNWLPANRCDGTNSLASTRRIAEMMNNNRVHVRPRRLRALAELPLCLALMTASCSISSGGAGGAAAGSGGTGAGGALGTGGSGSGGALGTGGSGSGGAPGTGGSGSGGAPQGTGGAGKGGEAGGGGGPAADAATGSGGSTSKGGAGGGASGGTNGGASGTSTGTMPSGTPVPSVGCGKTSTINFTAVPNESGTSVGTGKGGYVTVQVGGQNRGFAMRLPDNYDNSKPYWLIFGFHWNGGNSKEVDSGGSNGYQMAHFGLQKLSNNGAFFVAPDGLNAGWGGDNLPFVDAMVKLIEENYCIDTSRLYANGFSYGGGMSYAIACARAKVFRAVAIYEGAQLSGCDGGNDPIAYWQMAGTTDNTCSIGMATPMRDKFMKNNGCTGPTTEPPRPSGISQPHICTDYTGCSSGHPLRWCVHPSGHGNAIVDGTSDLYNSCATPPKTCSDSCKCTWVPEDVWKFFTSF